MTHLFIPLKIKQKCGIDFDYNDICNDLKYSFLNADDSNKYEFIKMIEEHIENTPKCKINSYCGAPFMITDLKGWFISSKELKSEN